MLCLILPPVTKEEDGWIEHIYDGKVLYYTKPHDEDNTATLKKPPGSRVKIKIDESKQKGGNEWFLSIYDSLMTKGNEEEKANNEEEGDEEESVEEERDEHFEKALKHAVRVYSSDGSTSKEEDDG